MKEPRRIREENASSAELSLLGSARLDVPPASSKTRLLATLGVATAGSAAAAATPGATTAWMVSKWLAAGMLAGTVATGSVEVVRSHLDARPRPDPSGASMAMAPAPNVRDVVPGTTDAIAPSPGLHVATSADSPAITQSAPLRTAIDSARQSPLAQSAPLPQSAPLQPAAPQSTLVPALGEEIAALDRARQALQARQPAAALRMLDAFEASFPRARLEPEARVLRMEVLLGMGRYDEARGMGRRLLELDPSSAHAQRVRSLLRNAEAREIQNPSSGH